MDNEILMLKPPQLPLTVRTGNLALSALRPLGFQRRHLDKTALLHAACAATGLDDFGDPEFDEGLERLLWSLAEEAQLTPLGRIIAREEIVTPLANRLRLVDYHKRHPDIGQTPVTAPIFIIGQGRSGTTVLHELLALDPQFRVPATWEVDYPFPPPEARSYHNDPRIAQVQKTLDRSALILPDFRNIHRMGATLPQECVRFTTGDFRSLIFWTNYHVPSYSHWLKEDADMRSAYHYHRAYLQLLQWKHPRSPWVLKSPAHLWSLDVLLEEYPDARFIQTHRDPLQMLASLTSLVTHLRKMSSNHVNAQAIAREWAEWNALGLNASAVFRDSGAISAASIVDIDFHGFMGNPLAEIEKIYQGFELELTAQTRQAMTNYLEEHSADQHGGHRYQFADTGLDLEEERARVAPYQTFFDTRIDVT
jgi:hypothetical protein